MAVGDLATLKLFIIGPQALSECGLGFQSKTAASNWRDLLATDFRTAIVPTWMACLGFNVACREITVADVVPGTGLDIIHVLSPEPHGTGGTFEAPPQLAYLISWYSDFSGRSKRGRNYLYGLPSDQIHQAEWDSDANTAVGSLVAAIMGRYGPAGTSSLAQFVIVSRVVDGAPLAVPEAVPVTTPSYSSVIRTQRRRQTL